MMELKWKRTVIGGQTAPGDFIAYCEKGTFARLLKEQYGPSAGTWGWGLSGGNQNPFFRLPYGSCDSKQEAVDLIKRMFETLQDAGKLSFHPVPPQRRSLADMD